MPTITGGVSRNAEEPAEIKITGPEERFPCSYRTIIAQCSARPADNVRGWEVQANKSSAQTVSRISWPHRAQV